jgi:hypothetical protein
MHTTLFDPNVRGQETSSTKSGNVNPRTVPGRAVRPKITQKQAKFPNAKKTTFPDPEERKKEARIRAG